MIHFYPLSPVACSVYINARDGRRLYRFHAPPGAFNRWVTFDDAPLRIREMSDEELDAWAWAASARLVRDGKRALGELARVIVSALEPVE